MSNDVVDRYGLAKKEQLEQLSQGGLPARVVNLVRKEFCSLEEIFASKAYYQLTQNIIAIEELAVPVYFNQKPP